MSDKTTNDPLEGCYADDGGLDNVSRYLLWDKGSSYAVLDGEFTIQDLRAIADHMEKNK